MKDYKGVAVYLLVAFGVAFGVEFALRALDWLPMLEKNLFQWLVLLALLFVPALAAVIARRVESADPADAPVFWPVPWDKAFRIALVVFALFALQNVIIAVSGWASPDWQLNTILAHIRLQVPTAPPVVMSLVPILGYTFVPVVSLCLGATLYAVLAFGGEYGWRAYLLPRLDKMGALRATAAVGLLWAAWWLPLAYFGHTERGSLENFAQFLPRFVLILVFLGGISGQILSRTGHAGLSAIFLGCVYSQWTGIWEHLLQNPQYPWAGRFGIVAVLVWLAAALAPWIFTGKAAPEKGAG